MTPVLEIQHLHKVFGGINAVADCSFTVEKGTITALIGPNGAGKSTVFNLITGFLEPTSGKILFQGEEITQIQPHQRARRGISRTFQLIRLFPQMTVLENMLLALPTNDQLYHAVFKTDSMKQLEHENIKSALIALEKVYLHVKVNELAKNLSYGQQKLLEIAKTLIRNPELVMLDEPAAGVNLTMLTQITYLMKELKKKGKTILFVEHNMDFVMDIADKVIVLDYGKEIAVGTPKKIQKNKRVIDAYLGTKGV